VITIRNDNGSRVPGTMTVRSHNGPHIAEAITVRSDNGSDVPGAITPRSDNFLHNDEALYNMAKTQQNIFTITLLTGVKAYIFWLFQSREKKAKYA
jgi:hypothetical protein